MPRIAKYKTKYLVYVDKDVMEKPLELFDAVFTHFCKKGLDTRKRKQFLAEFSRAVTPKDKLAVVDGWVQVRDVAGFPFTYEKEADNKTKISKATANVGNVSGASPQMMTVDDIKEDKVENTEAERGVSMDDEPDGEPESGSASE